jgi:heptosyltransferase-2
VSAVKSRILVIRGGAIGDFILTLPVIAALRRQFPQAHLEVLGYPHIAQLAVAGGLVDRVQPIEARGLAGFFARGGKLEPDLMNYFSEFDLVISYLYDPDEIFKTNVGRCLVKQFIVGPHRPDEADRIHATKVYLKPLERLAIFDADNVPRLSFNLQNSSGRADLLVSPDARQRVPTVAFHPGSGSEKKNWPETKWAGLIQQVIATTCWNLLLVGGEAEGERLRWLAAVLPPARCSIAQGLPLAELAQRIQSCAAFVGHDSGITHLAAAVGLPCVVLWADTLEEVWRPQGEPLVILKEITGVRAISVEKVLNELRKLVRE